MHTPERKNDVVGLIGILDSLQGSLAKLKELVEKQCSQAEQMVAETKRKEPETSFEELVRKPRRINAKPQSSARITNQEIMGPPCTTTTEVSNRWKFHDAEKDGPTPTVVSLPPPSRLDAFEVFRRYMAKQKRLKSFRKEIEMPYGR